MLSKTHCHWGGSNHHITITSLKKFFHQHLAAEASIARVRSALTSITKVGARLDLQGR